MKTPNTIRLKSMRILLLSPVVAVMIACGGSDSSGPSIRKDVMWSNTVFPRTASLAVSDTLTLDVKPYDHDGNVIVDDVSITYVSADTNRVKVSPTGKVTAVRGTGGQGVSITVTIRAGRVTARNYVPIGVTDGPVDVKSITVGPAFGGPVVPVGGTAFLSVQAFDADGRVVPGVFAMVEQADPNNAKGFLLIGTMLISTSFGSTYLRATTYINGRLLTDSVEFRTRYRDYTDLTVTRTAIGDLNTTFALTFGTNIYISPNGQVEFVNRTTSPIDITFDNPDDAKANAAGTAGGNIVGILAGRRVSRWFPTKGDHYFTVHSGPDSRRISVSAKDTPVP